MNKSDRAKLARDTIDDDIPQILKSNQRALQEVQGSELIKYSPSQLHSKLLLPQYQAEDVGMSAALPAQAGTPRIRIIQSDTYDAVQAMIKESESPIRIAALNMASAKQPGGGVLNGSIAQEESLSLRSTLYPSLNRSWYRLPDDTAIYTPDVLVFRNSENLDIQKSDWFFTDVISCAAIKGPRLVTKQYQDGTRTLEYELDQNYTLMVKTIRLIFQIAKEKGITHLVLGALGCGAYRNPPAKVAQIFKQVIYEDHKRGGIAGIEEVTFAIFDDGENLRVFEEAFRDAID